MERCQALRWQETSKGERRKRYCFGKLPEGIEKSLENWPTCHEISIVSDKNLKFKSYYFTYSKVGSLEKQIKRLKDELKDKDKEIYKLQD